ncbi:HdeD family acid-resistance protein [Traorella massiliensis]|uniref:HdeD family acid-resistance protein n=1 Tax=Traorella massiliensis TaxID=1903263 RepID=UPI002353F837|nr:DUF308 domain-containing protein [Traorella massiliensis]
MLDMIKELKKNMILLAVFYLILGIILVLFPEGSGYAICYLIGGLTIIYGIFHLVLYQRTKSPFVTYRYDLVQGIIGLAIGIYVMIVPEILIETLPVVLGVVVMIDSIVKIQNAWDLKRMGYDRWWLVMIGALVTLVFGLLMVFYPFTVYLSVIVFVGISLIVNGVSDLITIFILNKKVKEFKSKVEDIIIDSDAKEINVE